MMASAPDLPAGVHMHWMTCGTCGTCADNAEMMMLRLINDGNHAGLVTLVRPVRRPGAAGARREPPSHLQFDRPVLVWSPVERRTADGPSAGSDLDGSAHHSVFPDVSSTGSVSAQTRLSGTAALLSGMQ